jgi:hypothetical protein
MTSIGQKPGWLKHIVVPFFWKEMNGHSVILEPKLDGYVTIKSYIVDKFAQGNTNGNVSMQDPWETIKQDWETIKQDLVMHVANITQLFTENGIKHNDLHIDNVMIKVDNAIITDCKVIDYDWISFMQNHIVDILATGSQDSIGQYAKNVQKKTDLDIFKESLEYFHTQIISRQNGGKPKRKPSKQAADKPKKPRKVTNKSKLR